MDLITGAALDSPARVDSPVRSTVRVGVVQHAWRADAVELAEVLEHAVGLTAQAGASIHVDRQGVALECPAVAGSHSAPSARHLAHPTRPFALPLPQGALDVLAYAR
jgi:hypothetical protein